MKPAKRGSAPAVLFSVCVDPTIDTWGKDTDAQVRTFSTCHAWRVRRHGARWGAPIQMATNDPLELMAWMASHARPNSRNYVVSPCASDTLTLCDWWSECEASGVRWEPVGSKKKGAPNDGTTRFRRLVLRGTPDIIDYTRYGQRWVWLSGRQYLPLEEEQISEHLRIPWIDTAAAELPSARILRTARERSNLWLRALMQMSDWWQAHSKASWGFTAGQLAMGILRTHIAPKTLCTHSDARVHELEREGAYGGRASTWFMGDVGNPTEHGTPACPSPKPSKFGSIDGPCLLLDIRSMYPTILRDMSFPRKLVSYRENVRVDDVLDLSRDMGAIASVKIEARKGEYPRRVKDRIEYPLGVFDTVLTGPELQQCARDGRVMKVHRLALYDMGKVFSEAASELIGMRERARASGNWAWEFFAKLLGNSMGGKLAQRRGAWMERRREAPMQEWGEWYKGRGDDGKPRRFRSIAGLVWEYVREKSGAGAYTAAFDYLTAYGRLWMRRIREQCPVETVLSQDTDGIWVLPAAVDKLRAKGIPFGDTAGELKIASVSSCGRWFGPRHYYTQHGWILAGFCNPSVALDGEHVESSVDMNPVRSGATLPPKELINRTRRSVLRLEAPKGGISQSGWVSAPEAS